jgi:hypothetical protein
MTPNHLLRHLPQRRRPPSAGGGREVVLASAPNARYLDRCSGETMEAQPLKRHLATKLDEPIGSS